jgi:ectoine hydroxylase-related dioxygenase (phytanoyl-CoA dioxygenase family)
VTTNYTYYVQTRGWSRKEGVLYVQPPRSILDALVAIRVHLEDNDENNGALRVVPGSHQFDCKNTESKLCHVNAGGVLVLKPLILHKSSKLRSGTRRVLHFVFVPQ